MVYGLGFIGFLLWFLSYESTVKVDRVINFVNQQWKLIVKSFLSYVVLCTAWFYSGGADLKIPKFFAVLIVVGIGWQASSLLDHFLPILLDIVKKLAGVLNGKTK